MNRIGLVLLAIVAFNAPAARAAEQVREWEIIRISKAENYDKGNRTHDRLAGPYESYETCRNAITRIKVSMSGVKIQCAVR